MVKDNEFRQACCGSTAGDNSADMDIKYHPSGYGAEDMMDFIGDEKLWLKQYAKAWHIATENGIDHLNWLDQSAANSIYKVEKGEEDVFCSDLSKEECEV